MEENRCFRCLKSGNVARLIDAIYGNEIVKICEECALLEDVPVIRKPSSFQLEASQKPYTVHERLARMAGVKSKTETTLPRFSLKKDEVRGLTLDNLRKPKDYSEILQRREERARKRNIPLNLIENYNWYLQRARRSRKMTLTQLGAIISESDSTLKMIEDGFLPDDADRVLRKIEQFFKISLRKSQQEQESARIEQVKAPARVLSFNPKSLKDLTIHDLHKLKEAREKIEEEEKDKEIASNIIWQGRSKEDREKANAENQVETKAEEQINQGSDEEIKSKKSFWNIFRRKDKREDADEAVEDVFIAADISE